ncbi:hypothetical protein C8J57DRAFT_1219955 [Mycena rebaudengoi]|nr:hypothetical protein C8J57DRAFT_1219955 [Mycena rebaudengoi]
MFAKLYPTICVSTQQNKCPNPAFSPLYYMVFHPKTRWDPNNDLTHSPFLIPLGNLADLLQPKDCRNDAILRYRQLRTSPSSPWMTSNSTRYQFSLRQLRSPNLPRRAPCPPGAHDTLVVGGAKSRAFRTAKFSLLQMTSKTILPRSSYHILLPTERNTSTCKPGARRLFCAIIQVYSILSYSIENIGRDYNLDVHRKILQDFSPPPGDDPLVEPLEIFGNTYKYVSQIAYTNHKVWVWTTAPSPPRRDSTETTILPRVPRADVAACVGSNALYRREALKEIGGATATDHSEDLHSGFQMMKRGWEMKCIPLALACGASPDTAKAYFSQQMRWCSSSTTLVYAREFWASNLRIMQKLCFLSGLLY